MKLNVYQPWFINAYVELRVSSVCVFVVWCSGLCLSPVMPLNVTAVPAPPPRHVHTRRPDSVERLRCAPSALNRRGEQARLWPEDTAAAIQRAELRAAEHAIFATHLHESDCACASGTRMCTTVESEILGYFSQSYPNERVWAEVEWSGSWRWSWGIYSSIKHNIVKYHIQCKADIIKMRYTIQDYRNSRL